MNPIELPMAELKPALVGLGKVISKGACRSGVESQFLILLKNPSEIAVNV